MDRTVMRGSEDGPSRASVRGRLGLLPVVAALLVACSGEASPAATTGGAVPTSSARPESSIVDSTTTATSTPEPGDGDRRVFTGSGDDTIPLPGGVEYSVVRAVYPGDGAFQIRVLTSEADAIDGETSLVGVPEGPYAGEQLIRTPLADVTGLKVTATGVWEIELVSPDDVPHVGDEFSGSADSVLWYDGLGGTATVTRTGNGPFWLLAADGRYLVPSAFGDFTGAEQWPAGPILFEVHGRGDWSVTIDPAGRPTGTTLPAGTFIDSATAAMAEACIGSWVELQRFGHDGTVEAEPWRTLLDVVYTECDPAIAAIDPVMVRSPAGSPVHVLWEVLWLIESEASFVYMGFASCDGPCVLPPEVAEDFMQFGPDHTDVPPSLYGYLGDVPAGEYLALIPGLTVSV